ncbi:APC membrane recruitment protein 2 [Paramormyrops kingsleyae]|uniref:APC membrane recruitment protein 2 n=1 Tax=Paramormyrops kingsleyae TaxID=1676925 RepID=A0A3B3QW19_9TELE|nr:APC membrane recruitment protein 2 [Paramormyrops kingsleyae]
MDVQNQSSEALSCEPAAPGRINRAAFKLFGQRRAGAALGRSRTHDGLGERDKEDGGEPVGGARRLSRPHAATAAARHAVTKSLSFFSLLRRSGRGGASEPRPSRQRTGLRGLLGSMRWPRRHKEAQGAPRQEHGPLEPARDAVVLSLEPQAMAPDPPMDAAQDLNGHLPDSLGAEPSPSSIRTPLAAPTVMVTPPGRSGGTGHPPSEHSVDRLCCLFTDVTSLKSFDSLTGCGDIIADAEDEGADSQSSSGTGSSSGAGPGGEAPAEEDTSPARDCMPTVVPSVISPPVLEDPPTPLKAQGGVEAYMGGGEEMASPEQVDEADMQDLWHMLPRQGAPPPLAMQSEKKPPPVRALGLSKIPISGRVGAWSLRQTTPDEGRGKDLAAQEAPPNSDEGYWDSPTPGPDEDDEGGEEESASPLLRDSCSGDALYDLYVDPEPSPGLGASDEEVTKLSKLTKPPQVGPSPEAASSFRSLKGSTSLPRDSRIPISAKQVAPSHSASQGALLPGPPDAPQPKTELPRTKIPVSKVPVRRISNKPTSTRLHDTHRK